MVALDLEHWSWWSVSAPAQESRLSLNDRWWYEPLRRGNVFFRIGTNVKAQCAIQGKCWIRISWFCVRHVYMCICMLIPPIEPGLGRALLSRDNTLTMIISQIRARPRQLHISARLSPLKTQMNSPLRGCICKYGYMEVLSNESAFLTCKQIKRLLLNPWF